MVISNDIVRFLEQTNLACLILDGSDNVCYISPELKDLKGSILACSQESEILKLLDLQNNLNVKRIELEDMLVFVCSAKIPEQYPPHSKQNAHESEAFVRAITHDLGAPINNIKALLHLFEQELDANEKKYLFELIKRSVDTLSSRQKDLNKILKDDFLISDDPFSSIEICQPIRDIASEYLPAFKAQKGLINLHGAQQSLAFFSRTALRSVLENLLSNSIKYKKENTPPVVDIFVHDDPNHSEIIYRDNGAGMDMKKFNENPFGLYRRLHESAAQGSGLGLFITRTTIEKAGGSIQIDSAPDSGITFTIHLRKP